MAALSSGQRVVAWMDFTAPKRAVVKVQLLAANGTASGTEITVSDGDIINDTDSARVFALPQPDGGFLVAWNSPSLENLFGPPQPPTNWTDYLVKRFDAQGQQVGAEVSLFPPQTRANTSWTARALTGGGAVLLGNFDNDGSATAIVLDGSGNPTANVPGIGRGLSTIINTIGWNVAPTSDGGFVLTWVGENFGPTTPVSNTLYAQRYDHAGAAKEAPQPLFSTGSDTIWTRVVQTTTGNFVVAVDLLDGGPAFGPHRLQVSQFDPAWVHQATTSTGLDASIQGVSDMELAALADGGTLLTWGTRVVPTGGAVDPPGNVAQLVARRFAPSGLPFGDPFTVSDQANLSRYHALVPTADGGAQVALSHAGTSDESDLFVATFGP